MTWYLVSAIAVAIAGTVLDYETTKEALRLGGRERNPVARWLIGKVGVLHATVTFDALAITGMATLIYMAFGMLAASVWLVVVGLLQGYVAIWKNRAVIKRLRARGNG